MKPSEIEIKISEMTIADYDDVVSLWRSLSGMGLSGADEREEIEKFIAKNPTISLVAEAEVGMQRLTKRPG